MTLAFKATPQVVKSGQERSTSVRADRLEIKPSLIAVGAILIPPQIAAAAIFDCHTL